MRRLIFALLLLSACDFDGSRPMVEAVPATPPPPVFEPPEAGPVLGPITGGTLLFLRNSPGNQVAAADPDGDRVYVVDVARQLVTHSFALEPGDAPRRMAQLADGRVAVTLARGGIALFQPSRPAEGVQRLKVCELPRGVTYDARRDRILVACREGRLVEVSRAEGRVVRSVDLPPDLRDVVVSGERVYVTRFKSAHVLILDTELALLQEVAPTELMDPLDTAAVAYRAVPGPNSSMYLLHQVARTNVGAVVVELPPEEPEPPPYYGNGDQAARGCGGRSVVASVLSQVTAKGAVISSPAIAGGTLMVDLAIGGGATLEDPELRDSTLVVADAGSRAGSAGSPVRVFSTTSVAPVAGACSGLLDGARPSGGDPFRLSRYGLITSVDVDRDGRTVALINAPLSIQVSHGRVPLDTRVRPSLGYRLFHQDAGAGIACASCHPEGEDDGLVWQLPERRRTPALGGGLERTAPYHWSGNLPDLDALLAEVLVKRMGGPTLATADIQALAEWLESIPRIDVPAPRDVEAAQRGQAIYAADCASCHAVLPPESLDVGTGELMQVPALRGLMFRAPYLHDGCASTLADRFGQCSTEGHGPRYAEPQVRDLVAYLQTL